MVKYFTEDEVVDTFMRNVLYDEDFVAWLKKQRFNKKIIALLLENKEPEGDDACTD